MTSSNTRQLCPANVGIDRETPVSDEYTEETSRFTGTIDQVTISVK